MLGTGLVDWAEVTKLAARLCPRTACCHRDADPRARSRLVSLPAKRTRLPLYRRMRWLGEPRRRGEAWLWLCVHGQVGESFGDTEDQRDRHRVRRACRAPGYALATSRSASGLLARRRCRRRPNRLAIGGGRAVGTPSPTGVSLAGDREAHLAVRCLCDLHDVGGAWSDGRRGGRNESPGRP